MEEGEPSSSSGSTPARPQSPFVKGLRMQVALSRQPEKQPWDRRPSVGTWLSPRSPRNGGPAVSFAADAEVLAITHRDDCKLERVLLELNFKGTLAKPFKLENVDASLTVRNVKELCEAKCSMPPEQQRLLFKGVILQDNQRLQDTKLVDKATLFLVKGASGTASSSDEPAQATEPEEHHEMHHHVDTILCIECGVNPGRLLTDGLCSICFRELVMRENAALKKRKEEAKRKEEEARRLAEQRVQEEQELEAKRQKNITRCYQCGKKTGLTGFQCKCGYYFCAAHRHAEDHACAFDHKAHGREILSQQNPKVQTGGLD
jgi:ribosomal protein S14